MNIRPHPDAAAVPVTPVHLVEPTPLVLRGRRFDAAAPAVMGIVNRTPDSFWGGNRHADLGSALRALEVAVHAGADIVDVGGVRAGQEGEWVDEATEIARVVPFLEEARERHPDLLLSLDTWRSPVARAAAGCVDLVNDTWAGADPLLVEVAAEIGAGYVVSHTGGLPPRTDPVEVDYGPDPDDVLRDVIATLTAGARTAARAGIPAERIRLDPTLDFGKTTAHSLRLLRAGAQLSSLGHPVMQAISRKDFVGETLDLAPADRLEGSLAATAVSAWLGVTVFRAHDVHATRLVLDMVASIRGDRPPDRAERGMPR